MSTISPIRQASSPEQAAEFINQGFTYLAVTPELKAGWHSAHRWFQDKLVRSVARLPRKYQLKFQFFFPGGDAKRADDGLVRRVDMDGDHKWFLHLRPWTVPERQLIHLFWPLREYFPNWKSWWPEFQVWHQEVMVLAEQTRQLVEDLAAELDHLHPAWNLVNAMRHPDALKKHALRFLDYDPKPEGFALAELHKDFSLISADVMATHPGLCLSPDEGALNPAQMIEEKSNNIIVFPGRKMHSQTEEMVPGMCHGVRSVNPGERRGAVVLFLHGPGPMGPSCPS